MPVFTYAQVVQRAIAIDREIKKTQECVAQLREEIAERERYLIGLQAAKDPMRVDLVDPQGQLMAEIADKRMTRDDVVTTYAFALRQRDEVDFRTVNAAILGRWSFAALKYIKDKAWRIAEGRS